MLIMQTKRSSHKYDYWKFTITKKLENSKVIGKLTYMQRVKKKHNFNNCDILQHVLGEWDGMKNSFVQLTVIETT